MLNSLTSGFLLGGVAIFIDHYVVMGLLGFENPYFLVVLAVFWFLAGVGFRTADEKLPLVLFMLGVPLGAIFVNYTRVRLFAQESLLSGVGL